MEKGKTAQELFRVNDYPRAHAQDVPADDVHLRPHRSGSAALRGRGLHHVDDGRAGIGSHPRPEVHRDGGQRRRGHGQQVRHGDDRHRFRPGQQRHLLRRGGERFLDQVPERLRQERHEQGRRSAGVLPPVREPRDGLQAVQGPDVWSPFTIMHVGYMGRDVFPSDLLVKEFGGMGTVMGSVDTKIMAMSNPKAVYEQAKTQICKGRDRPVRLHPRHGLRSSAILPAGEHQALVQASKDFGTYGTW